MLKNRVNLQVIIWTTLIGGFISSWLSRERRPICRLAWREKYCLRRRISTPGLAGSVLIHTRWTTFTRSDDPRRRHALSLVIQFCFRLSLCLYFRVLAKDSALVRRGLWSDYYSRYARLSHSRVGLQAPGLFKRGNRMAVEPEWLRAVERNPRSYLLVVFD